MNKPDSKGSLWRAAAFASAAGVNLVVCIALGYFAGSFMSQRMGGQKGWLIAGVLTGMFVGLASIVLLIRRFLEDTND